MIGIKELSKRIPIVIRQPFFSPFRKKPTNTMRDEPDCHNGNYHTANERENTHQKVAQLSHESQHGNLPFMGSMTHKWAFVKRKIGRQIPKGTKT